MPVSLVGADQLEALLADDTAYDVAGDGETVVAGDYRYDLDAAGADINLVGASMAKAGLSPALISATLKNLVGALRRPAQPPPQQLLSQTRPKPHVNWPATLVEDKAYTARRRFPLGITSGVEIPGGATANIRVQANQPFRPSRLMVGSNIAPRFTMSDFRIGMEPQFMSNDPISCVSFAENATEGGFQCDTVQTAQVISFTVTNVSNVATVFLATLWGVTVR